MVPFRVLEYAPVQKSEVRYQEGIAAIAPSWTLLIYRIPTQPSRLRLQVWRRLQALGARYLQDAVCVLPPRDDLRQELSSVADSIREMGGTAHVFDATSIHVSDEEIVASFRDLADERYAAILKRIEVGIELLQNNVGLADIEVAEEALKRERMAYLRAHTISYFGGTVDVRVVERLEELRRILDDIRSAMLG
jgi:hypothetical protein